MIWLWEWVYSRIPLVLNMAEGGNNVLGVEELVPVRVVANCCTNARHTPSLSLK